MRLLDLPMSTQACPELIIVTYISFDHDPVLSLFYHGKNFLAWFEVQSAIVPDGKDLNMNN